MEKKLESAQFYFDIGEKQKAYNVYKEIIYENPNIPEAWYGIARCIDDLEHKKYCLQRAIKLRPNYESALSLLRWCEDEKGQRVASNIGKVKPVSPIGERDFIAERIGISNPKINNHEIADTSNASISSVKVLTDEITNIENSDKKKSGIILPIILGIILFIIGILVMGRIINNRNIRIQNSQLYTEFIRESSKLDIMTGQGVNFTDFGNQLAEVKTVYSSIEYTSALPDYQKREFNSAIYGWDLALEAWNLSRNDELDSKIGWDSVYGKTLEEYLEIDNILVAFNLVEGYEPVISLLLTKASEHYNTGVNSGD